MNKETRLNWLKDQHEKHQQKTQELPAGEIPVSDQDIKETVEELDSFTEYSRDQHSNSEALTSDEK